MKQSNADVRVTFGVLHRAFTEQNDIADISNKYPVYLIDVKNGISTWENESKF